MEGFAMRVFQVILTLGLSAPLSAFAESDPAERGDAPAPIVYMEAQPLTAPEPAALPPAPSPVPFSPPEDRTRVTAYEVNPIDTSGGAEAVLEPREKMGVLYAMGGVGKEETDALKAIENQFNAKILSSLASGEYVFGTEVSIYDANGGLVFEQTLGGPYLYVQLPPGEYRIAAVQNGKEQQKTAKLKKFGSQQINFGW